MDTLSYMYGFLRHDNPITQLLVEDARSRDDIQPFVELETARLLSLLIQTLQAKRVLELGCGIGYSSIWMGEALKRTGGTLLTLDNHERTSREALGHIADAAVASHVELHVCDAAVRVPELAQETPGSFDLIFQDCGKYLYDLLYEDVYSLLRPGGLLVTDDTLFKTESSVRKGLGEHVDRYNRRLFNDPRYYSTMLPAGHGVAISLKIDPVPPAGDSAWVREGGDTV